MKTEISKGTQKFIWHLVAFVAVFVLALVIICRVLPEPNRTATIDQSTQITTSKTEDNLSTDFDSVKERVDQANNSTGKEIKDLYSGEGKSTMQKQLETRLFFNTLKSILICVLLVVVVIVLIKKGFSLKKVKKIFDEEIVVLAFIKSQAKLAGELEERIARINENAEKLRQTQSDEEITLRERLEKLEFYLRSSFENYISGVITESDYLFNKSKYEAEIASCQAKLNTGTTSKPKVSADEVRTSPYVTSMKKFSRARVLTREMCVSLIELIEVDKNNNVIITPRYRDEFACLCDRIEKEESEMKQNG